jgi:hypothetical protein
MVDTPKPGTYLSDFPLAVPRKKGVNPFRPVGDRSQISTCEEDRGRVF